MGSGSGQPGAAGTITTDACVLVVDDDTSVRTSVAEILRVAGYRVREAGDGESALDQLARHRVGVVVLDLRMPERDGMGVLAAVGAHAPPVVLVSGYPLAGDAGVHTDPHVFMVLQKPFKPVALLDAVAGAMGLRVTA